MICFNSSNSACLNVYGPQDKLHATSILLNWFKSIMNLAYITLYYAHGTCIPSWYSNFLFSRSVDRRFTLTNISTIAIRLIRDIVHYI